MFIEKLIQVKPSDDLHTELRIIWRSMTKMAIPLYTILLSETFAFKDFFFMYIHEY